MMLHSKLKIPHSFSTLHVTINIIIIHNIIIMQSTLL